MQYSLPGLDQDVPGAKTMFTKSHWDFLGRIKETENLMLTANEERETDPNNHVIYGQVTNLCSNKFILLVLIFLVFQQK